MAHDQGRSDSEKGIVIRIFDTILELACATLIVSAVWCGTPSVMQIVLQMSEQFVESGAGGLRIFLQALLSIFTVGMFAEYVLIRVALRFPSLTFLDVFRQRGRG